MPSQITETDDPTRLAVIKDKVTGYTVIRAEDMSDAYVQIIGSFCEMLNKTYEVTLPLKTDKVSEGSEIQDSLREILIGKTNRPASKALLALLPETTFGIEITATQVVIAASSDTLLEETLTYFTETYVDSQNGSLILPVGERYISGVITSEMYDRYDLSNMPGNLVSIDEIFFEFPSEGKYRVLQGGCSDGRYFYFCRENNALEPHESYVYKFDVAAGELVQKSASLRLDHSNDITYNPNTGELVVAHNSPNRETLSILDPDTLEVKRTFKIPVSIFSIAYEPIRNVYVVGIAYGQNFTVLNENFEIDGDRFESFKVYNAKQTGNTTQSVDCDESYIYFLQYDENVIMVYDWDGKFIRKVKLSIPTSYEPENITVIGDAIYIGCNNPSWTGGVIYRTEILPAK